MCYCFINLHYSSNNKNVWVCVSSVDLFCSNSRLNNKTTAHFDQTRDAETVKLVKQKYLNLFHSRKTKSPKRVWKTSRKHLIRLGLEKASEYFHPRHEYRVSSPSIIEASGRRRLWQNRTLANERTDKRPRSISINRREQPKVSGQPLQPQ